MNSTPPAARSAWFATTQWSLVISAGGGDAALSGAALQRLCENYWQPLYSYVRRRGYSPEDAQDLTQEFFARLLQHNRLAKADQRTGKINWMTEPILRACLKSFNLGLKARCIPAQGTALGFVIPYYQGLKVRPILSFLDRLLDVKHRPAF